MPALLKFPSSLLPFKHPTTITTTTSATTWARTTVTTSNTKKIVTPKSHSSSVRWWWWRNSLSPTPHHSSNTFCPINHRPIFIRFRGGQKLFSTQMGPPPPPMPEDYDRYEKPLRDDYDRHEKPMPAPQSEKLLTLPTMLTIARVAAVPLLVSTFYVDSSWGPPVTTGIFIAAAITDWLDGYLARKMKLGTTFGAFLDPVADKLMVAATLVLLCTKPLEAGIFGQAPWLLTVPSIAIIGREITMSAVREWAASQGSKLSGAVAVNNLGKWKTATQMTALTILLATRDSSIAGTGTVVASGVLLLYISAWLALWSLFVYMRKIWKVLMM